MPLSSGDMAEKTSQTHPLEIPAVSTPGGGRIGMTLCPGKHQSHAVTGPWNRDLAADMDVIKTFGADTLITLMETAELAEAAVTADSLGRSAAERVDQLAAHADRRFRRTRCYLRSSMERVWAFGTRPSQGRRAYRRALPRWARARRPHGRTAIGGTGLRARRSHRRRTGGQSTGDRNSNPGRSHQAVPSCV